AGGAGYAAGLAQQVRVRETSGDCTFGRWGITKGNERHGDGTESGFRWKHANAATQLDDADGAMAAPADELADCGRNADSSGGEAESGAKEIAGSGELP